ncbi:DUF4785 domain-containing protein [Marinicella meishanensis]|uniref:DUF4785 domain-containing protein n=1 Tax=Marinicella meishanensis TaxID=2873263 RepID=UPI001CBF542D|nr:DUF4785 domain-containing protein [Marinicella sp. NBU2979]
MKKHILITACLTTMASVSPADIQWNETPQAQTLAVFALKSTPIKGEQQRVAFNQNLLGQAFTPAANAGYLSQSKQYWLDASGAQLAQGLALPLTSDIAVIRLNPLQVSDKSLAIEPAQVQLSMGDQPVSATTFVGARELKAAGMPVGDHSVALKVQAQAGELTLKVNGIGSDAYVVHVLEPNSTQVLSLQTTQQSHQVGQDVVVKVAMSSDPESMQIQGYVTAPNGEKISDLTFQPAADGSQQAVLSGLLGQAMTAGLWEIHTVTESVVNGQKVLRDASTAFAVNLPSAQFDGQLQANGQQLELGIDNALAGRYEIRGTLLGTDAQGQAQPIALLMTAQWLSAGSHRMAFDWPTELVAQSGLQAPFTVLDVELKNQSLMAPVQQVQAGFTLGEAPVALFDPR